MWNSSRNAPPEEAVHSCDNAALARSSVSEEQDVDFGNSLWGAEGQYVVEIARVLLHVVRGITMSPQQEMVC